MADVPLPGGSQHIAPYVYYDDPRAATAFLCEVFGFEQTMLLEWPDGAVAHAEVSLNGERVLIGYADPSFGLSTPRTLGAQHTVLCVYVSDVDAHCEQATKAGAEIVRPLADQFYGSRAYTARDCEGTLWEFRQHLREPSHEELTESLANLARLIGR
ncbi:MAG: VOC family protein [Chloroflexota bacterium]|nr:VOC family protein [Chloroflexota bacterium]